MELAQYIGSWGLCDPSPEFIEERTDTRYLRRWRDPQPFRFSDVAIYYCVGVEKGYLILTNGFENYRAVPETYSQLQSAVYKWGDVVYIRKKLDRPRQVIDVGYHSQNKVLVYRIECSDPRGLAYWFDYQLIAAKDVDFD